MMMMSSNTVGNNDFNNISGAVPPPSRKVTLPKDKSPQLASSKPDSFERANPRDNTPEAPPTAETLAKTGGSSVIAIGLSAVSLIGAGIAGWFAISKGEEAKLAKTAADAAKEEVGKLKTEISALGKNLTIEEVETKALELVNKALENHPDKTKITEQINKAVAGKLDKAQVEALLTTALKDHLNKAEIEKLIQSFTDAKVDKTELAKLEKALAKLAQALEEVRPTVGGVRVSDEIKTLFKTPLKHSGNLDASPFAKAIEAYNHPAVGASRPSSFSVIQEGFNSLDDKTPGALKRFSLNLNQAEVSNIEDPYHYQFNGLRDALCVIKAIFEDKNALLEDLAEDHIVTKYKPLAQAVVDAGALDKNGTVEQVQNAQKALVAELQQQFGRSHTQKFEADYPKAVRGFTSPANQEATNGWVLKHFKLEKSFDDMAKVITEADQGLDGTQTNNTHKDPHTLATVVLPNLKDALILANADYLEKYSSTGRIKVVDGIKSSRLSSAQFTALEKLVDTLDAFELGFRPITSEKLELHETHSFVETSAEELAKLTGERKLQAEIMNARLNNNTAEIETTTQKMYELLRLDLGALKNAEAKASPAS